MKKEPHIEDMPSNIPKGKTYLCPSCGKLCVTDAQSNQSHHESPACEAWVKDQMAIPGAKMTHRNGQKVS
jgi:hypothetical protein